MLLYIYGVKLCVSIFKKHSIITLTGLNILYEDFMRKNQKINF